MSVWSRLFGRSNSSQTNSKPRLGLESLEAREVPAALATPLRWFQVGPAPAADAAASRDDSISWGFENSAAAAARHRFFAIVDRTTLGPTTELREVPAVTPLVAVPPVSGEKGEEPPKFPSTSFTVVGGWGASMNQQVDPSNPNVVFVGGSTRHGGSAGRITAVAVDPPSPTAAINYPLYIQGLDGESRAVSHAGTLNIRDSLALGNVSRDQFVFGVEMPTAARDFHLDIPPIKGEASDEKNKPQATGDTYSAIAFVGGWGSSAAPSGPGSLGIEVHVVRGADPLPVLLVIADQRDFYQSTDDGVGDGRSPALRKGGWVMDVTLPPSADGRVTDDVAVDGRIITGENYDSASIATSGYIRIKKLNSGG